MKTTTDILVLPLGQFLQLDILSRKQLFTELSIPQRLAYIEAFCDFDPLDIAGKAPLQNTDYDPLATILSATDRTKIENASFVQSQVAQPSEPAATKLTVIEGGKQ